MSTKCTIACAEEPTDFHLYYDYSDDLIHLELSNISVVIPKDVFNEIHKELKDPNFKLPISWKEMGELE